MAKLAGSASSLTAPWFGSGQGEPRVRNIVVFGSTGSIGEQTLQVAAEFPDRVRVIGLAAHRQVRRLEEQVAQFKPRYAAVGDGSAVVAPTIQRGQQALIDMATAPDVDLVVMATVGAAGLP